MISLHRFLLLSVLLLSACRSSKPCATIATSSTPPETPVKVVDISVETPVVTPTPKDTVVIAPPKESGTTLTVDQKRANEIIAALKAKSPLITSFEAQTSMNVDAPEMQQDANAVIRMKVGEAMMASLRPSAMNVEVAKSLVTTDSFFVYNKLERTFIYGNVALANQYLPISGTLEELLRTLMGSMIPSDKEMWSATQKGNMIELRNEKNTLFYTVDPQINRVVQFEVKNEQGQQVQLATFKEHDDFDGFLIPRTIVLSQPLEARTVSLYHRRISVNPAELKIEFNVNRKGLKLTKVE